MRNGEDTSDATDVPEAIERGLAFGYRHPDESGPSLLDRIREVTGRRPTVSLPEAEPSGDTPMLEPLVAAERQGDAGKYRLLGVLGRGGVGTVHRGHDTDLGRDVALKFLHEKYRDQPAILHRFVEEAQIGGQLQHPGIVPVYDLGMSGGRPFFTMKLVKGQTLAQKLAERSSPASDRRTFLSIFEGVCQTIAYAHARGVVHRDLKPANIMVGSFGEVQVVDWGMGKVLERGGIADEQHAAEPRAQESVIETVRSGGQGTQSVMGSVMGTPAYMPPEQARGDVDAMDTRSDVFALGAILCEILTGQPPYVGERDEVLRLAADAKLDGALARLRDCGAEAETVELTTRCLMAEPSARPQSAKAVAKALHDHLAAAEQRAYDASLRALTLKRTQKLGIALTVVIAAGLAASLWFWRSASIAATNERAAKNNEKTARLRADAKAKEARDSLANFDRLSQVVRLDTALESEAALYPAWPRMEQAMRDWLKGEAALPPRALPDLRRTVDRVKTRARERERRLQGVATAGREASPLSDDADQFLLATLSKLITDIGDFAKHTVPAVERRLAWAERIEQSTLERHAKKWNEARLAILAADGITASKLYAEVPFELKPQMGLVPIGMNPRSKLWEFYHLRSAADVAKVDDPATIEIPTFDASGEIAMSGRGIVFVLIPGGKFFMGAQNGDEADPNFDAGALSNEAPVREVELAPYFLAKHELTQGQWARLSGGQHPSYYQLGSERPGMPVPIGDSHPVETVSWTMCAELLRRHGLVFPTEAQWEYACRAGTPTPWSTGREPRSLEGHANVLDRTGQNVPPVWAGGEAFDDRFKGPAPVGTYEPNPLGLYDMHGNVWEWCRDWYAEFTLAPRKGDGLRQPDPSIGARVFRGGSFRDPAALSRAAVRYGQPPELRGPRIGVRPARAIDP